MQILKHKETIEVTGGILILPQSPIGQIEEEIKRFTTFFTASTPSKYNKKVFEFEA